MQCSMEMKENKAHVNSKENAYYIKMAPENGDVDEMFKYGSVLDKDEKLQLIKVTLKQCKDGTEKIYSNDGRNASKNKYINILSN